MFLAPVWKNWCVDKETTDEIENYEPAELNTLLEQRYAKISILWESRSMLTKNPSLQAENCLLTNPHECQGKQAPDRQHSVRCILISM